MDIRGVTTLLGVYDMPTSLKFYRDTLGCEVVATSPMLAEGYFHWTLLRLGAAELMLNTNFEFLEERLPQPDATRNLAHHDVCLYFACADLDGAYRELSAKGLEVREPITSGYGMRQLFLTDPDGYSIVFQCPAESSSD